MGADHIEFVPSEAIHNIKRFFTTNGQILLAEELGYIFLYDACLILRICLRSLSVNHFQSPKKFYFSDVRVQASDVLVDVYSGYGKRKSEAVIIVEGDWIQGFGVASDGVFPSAYMPWVDEQYLLR